MKIEPLALEGARLIRPVVHGDHRGSFCETWNAKAAREQGFEPHFVQDNESFSAAPMTLRGLHMQGDPAPQGKLIRVVSGAIRDVLVDARPGSETFGKWLAVDITAGNHLQIWVPPGFLHGLLTLEPDTRVIYKVDAHYDPSSERAVRFDDPEIGVDWGVPLDKVILSAKDETASSFADYRAGLGQT